MTKHPHHGEDASAEPGGFDEYDHAPVPDAADTGSESVNAEAANDGVAPAASGATAPSGDAGMPPAEGDEGGIPAAGGEAHPDTVLAAERLADLQRLQAEYVNYKRRVDRDRAVMQERAVHDVLEALLPVLDDIHAAREHGDLADGPFAAIADKLETALGKYGLERYGAKGEEFDPMVHEALMHGAWPEGDPALDGAEATTVVTVLQPGYRAGERVLRPARVAVADPA